MTQDRLTINEPITQFLIINDGKLVATTGKEEILRSEETVKQGEKPAIEKSTSIPIRS